MESKRTKIVLLLILSFLFLQCLGCLKKPAEENVGGTVSLEAAKPEHDTVLKEMLPPSETPKQHP